MSDVIERYLQSWNKRMLHDYERIRSTRRDSDVKGGDNEETIADFVRLHWASGQVATNVEIIDSFGSAADEVDVCACNPEQPFGPVAGQIIIVEGVDFVIQVKARLDSVEMKRAFKNCKSAKTLKRVAGKGDVVVAPSTEDVPYYVDRIPYFIVAFSSPVSLVSLRKNFVKCCEGLDLELQPDAVFVLGMGTIYNFREGKGKGARLNEEPMKGVWSFQTGETTLVHFMRNLHSMIPRFRRAKSPLTHYFPSVVYSAANGHC